MKNSSLGKMSHAREELDRKFEELKRTPFDYGAQDPCPSVLWNLIERHIATNDDRMADWIAAFLAGTLRCEKRWDETLMKERREAYVRSMGEDAVLKVLNGVPDQHALTQARRAFNYYYTWDHGVLVRQLQWKTRFHYYAVFSPVHSAFVQTLFGAGAAIGIWKYGTSLRSQLKRWGKRTK